MKVSSTENGIIFGNIGKYFPSQHADETEATGISQPYEMFKANVSSVHFLSNC